MPNVFERVEIKYILDALQTEALVKGIQDHMKLDKYGRSLIQSIYYDTPNYELIRRSLEKPLFKEKMRLRSYGLADDSKEVFLELKRKCNGVVYKRRVPLILKQANNFFANQTTCGAGQIAKEVSYFAQVHYPLTPAYLIIVDREAYYEIDGQLRLTIDYAPRYRDYNFSLNATPEGKPILNEGETILEIKALGSYPLWLVKLLNDIHAKKRSISKVGQAYILAHKQERKLQLWKTSSIQSSQVLYR